MTGKGQPNPRRANGYRRDQVRRRVLAEESDCWLCGKPVDKTLGFMRGTHSSRCRKPDCTGCVRDPMSPEVDEIVPVSLGGDPFARANCRLAHRPASAMHDEATAPASRRAIPSH